MKDNKLQKNETNGEFHWRFDNFIIDVMDGELVYAGNTHIVECQNHNTGKGNSNWKLAKEILSICFCVSEKNFFKLFKCLSSESIGYSIAKTFLEKEVEELEEKLGMIRNLLQNDNNC